MSPSPRPQDILLLRRSLGTVPGNRLKLGEHDIEFTLPNLYRLAFFFCVLIWIVKLFEDIYASIRYVRCVFCNKNHALYSFLLGRFKDYFWFVVVRNTAIWFSSRFGF